MLKYLINDHIYCITDIQNNSSLVDLVKLRDRILALFLEENWEKHAHIMDCYLEFIWISILPNKVHCSSSSEQYKKKAIMDDIWVFQMANNYPLAIFSEKRKPDPFLSIP